MARDRANIRVDMWADTDVRCLSLGAQHLYMLILTHSSLTYAGVADWRPGRLAALTSGRTGAEVERDARELQAGHFIYADENTEEVMVRSFLRHDGVIKHPRLKVSMANDYAGIASTPIREFIAWELQKLHREQPDLTLWADQRVQTILKAKARDLKAEPQGLRQEVCHSDAIASPDALANPLAKDSHSVSMRTATATATSVLHTDDSSSDVDTSDGEDASETKTYPEHAHQICEALVQRITLNGGRPKNITGRWLDAADKLVRIDGYTPDQILKVVDWCQADPFWKTNILSTPKLREKFEQLKLKMFSQAQDPHRGQAPADRAQQTLNLGQRLQAEYDHQTQQHQIGA